MLEIRKKLENLGKNGKEEPKTHEKYQNSSGKRMKIKLKYQGLRGTYVFLTSQIFNIFPIFTSRAAAESNCGVDYFFVSGDFCFLAIVSSFSLL